MPSVEASMVSTGRWAAATAAMALLTVPASPPGMMARPRSWRISGVREGRSRGLRGRYRQKVLSSRSPRSSACRRPRWCQAGSADPDVRSVELDSRVHSTVVTEPTCPEQWGIDAVKAFASVRSQRVRESPSRWSTPVWDARHEDLAGRVLTGGPLRSGPGGWRWDRYGHGTWQDHRKPTTGVGGVGVAPEADPAVRVLDKDGVNYASDVAEDHLRGRSRRAGDQPESGWPIPSSAQEAAIEYAVQKGVTVWLRQATAGPGAAPEYPAAPQGHRCSRHTTPEDQAASFSTRAALCRRHRRPGTMILSSLPGDDYAL